jgi:hypothetical protein
MVQWTFPEGDRDYLGRTQRLPLDVGPVPRKQHVVSRAILKGFATPGTAGGGWSLRLFNVAQNEVLRDRGFAGCAYVRDFIMYAAQSAELAWKAVEDRLPPSITAAKDGVLHASPSSELRDTITDAVPSTSSEIPGCSATNHALLRRRPQTCVRARCSGEKQCFAMSSCAVTTCCPLVPKHLRRFWMTP